MNCFWVVRNIRVIFDLNEGENLEELILSNQLA